MKSVEEQLENERQNYILDQRKKSFSEAAILTAWKEAVMVEGSSVEEKLSRAKKLTASVGIKESHEIRESRRIDRKNGSGTFTENNTVSRDERIMSYMKESISYREACFMLGENPERGAKQPASITEAIIAAWKKYTPWISEKDARSLAERGVQP